MSAHTAEFTSAGNYRALREDPSAGEVVSLFDRDVLDQYRQAIATYGHLLNLQADWDGAGAKRIPATTFQFGLQLLQQAVADGMHAKVQIVPLSYGGIQLEWHSMNADLEVEIERPNRFQVYFHDAKTGQEEEFIGKNDFSRIEPFFSRL